MEASAVFVAAAAAAVQWTIELSLSAAAAAALPVYDTYSTMLQIYKLIISVMGPYNT